MLVELVALVARSTADRVGQDRQLPVKEPTGGVRGGMSFLSFLRRVERAYSFDLSVAVNVDFYRRHWTRSCRSLHDERSDAIHKM